MVSTLEQYFAALLKTQISPLVVFCFCLFPSSIVNAQTDPYYDYKWLLTLPDSPDYIGKNRYLWFTDYQAGCQYWADNYCTIYAYIHSAVGYECYFATLTNVVISEANGTHAVCSVNRKTNWFGHPDTPSDAIFLYGNQNDYKLADIADAPPPQQCVGDPIETSNGTLHEKEIDFPAKNDGLVEFVRSYSTANSQIKWRHNYERSLQAINFKDANNFRYTTGILYGKQSACTWGSTHLSPTPTESWSKNISAVVSGDLCKFMGGTTNKRNLVLLKDDPDTGYVDQPINLPKTIRLSRPDGSVVVYQRDGVYWYAINGTSGFIESISSGNSAWRYTDGNVIEEFSVNGQLLSIVTNQITRQVRQDLTYDTTTGNLLGVIDSTGNSLVFTYDQGKLSKVTNSNNEWHQYSYNTSGMLYDVLHSNNTRKTYYYENSLFPNFLTGITDERGVRYVTWKYDALGRAVSSEHAGGVDKTSLAFNSDGSTTVTNPLNKQTIYRFDDITGARRVTAVQGQPTASCLGANQNYTYTPEGWLASKTDWVGNKTVYTYSPKGQEISRTEGIGTSVAKTVTTEWHPSFNLKTRITESDRETTYTYDTNGFLTSENTHAIAAQLSISTNAPSSINVDTTPSFSITLSTTNSGPSSAQNVVLNLALNGLTVTTLPSGCTGSGSTLTCALGTIATNQTITLTLSVQTLTPFAPGINSSSVTATTSTPLVDPTATTNQVALVNQLNSNCVTTQCTQGTAQQVPLDTPWILLLFAGSLLAIGFWRNQGGKV